MKWKDAAILLLQPNDRVIQECAYSWRERYAIPIRRCFSHPFSGRHPMAGTVPVGFTRLQSDSLAFSSLESKIIVVSHGHPDQVSNEQYGLDASQFAAHLAGWGLKNVGLLTFRNCLVGKARYLDNLLVHLNARGIGVGWILGYKDRASSVAIDPSWLSAAGCVQSSILLEPQHWLRHPVCNHPMANKRRPPPQTLAHEAVGFFDRVLREATNGRKKLSDEQRVKIVRGNRTVQPPGGSSRRYPAYLETAL